MGGRKRQDEAKVAAAAAAATAAARIPLTFTDKMVAGAIARGVAQTILHPIDVVRTRVQARGIGTTKWGVSTFVKGLGPQVWLSLPAGAVQFTSFEAAKDFLGNAMPGDQLRDVRTLLAGAFGATIAATVRVPQEVLKQRVQADVYPNAFKAITQTIGKDGVLGLYKGWGATLSRDIPWNGLSFMFHASFKNIFTKYTGRVPDNGENLCLAGAAGAGAAVLTMPIDVIKTRLMTQAAGGTAMYTGIMGTMKKIVAEEGPKTLMKGLLPRICFLAPLAGVTFSVYEGVAKIIRKRKAREISERDTEIGSAQISGHLFTAGNLKFASAPVRKLDPGHSTYYSSLRSRLVSAGVVGSEADALVYLSAFQPVHRPYFLSTI